MKRATNSFANVDNLGRIVIPKHLRTAFNLESGCALELFTEADTIVIRKYQPGCIFCGNISELHNYENKSVCSECIEKLSTEIK